MAGRRHGQRAEWQITTTATAAATAVADGRRRNVHRGARRSACWLLTASLCACTALLRGTLLLLPLPLLLKR